MGYSVGDISGATRRVAGMLAAITMLAMTAVSSCGDGKKEESGDTMVVALGDSVLNLSEVLQQIPRGLEPADSLAMFRAIVETWLQRQVLMSVAVNNIPDMSEIDRMVDNYRTDLILGRYLSILGERNNRPDNRQVEQYYRANADSMILEEPVVKGIFLKVNEKDPNIDKLRQWMREADEEAVDNLEVTGLREATQYEYFQDRWHAWHEVADLVPYRFFDADAFLQSTKDFETSYGGSVYIIHIAEYVGTGEKMPADYAKANIEEMIRRSNVAAGRRKLITDIYRREVDEGRLRGGLYDPETGKLRQTDKKKE